MKTRSFVAAIAVLSLSAFAFTAGDAFATKIVEIKGKYTKIKLDGICAANGGSSYGSAEGSYGCTKGNVSVECHNDGSCKGYVDLVASPGGSRVWSNPEAVLQQSETPAKPRATTGAAGGTLTSQ